MTNFYSHCRKSFYTGNCRIWLWMHNQSSVSVKELILDKFTFWTVCNARCFFYNSTMYLYSNRADLLEIVRISVEVFFINKLYQWLTIVPSPIFSPYFLHRKTSCTCLCKNLRHYNKDPDIRTTYHLFMSFVWSIRYILFGWKIE